MCKFCEMSAAIKALKDGKVENSETHAFAVDGVDGALMKKMGITEDHLNDDALSMVATKAAFAAFSPIEAMAERLMAVEKFDASRYARIFGKVLARVGGSGFSTFASLCAVSGMSKDEVLTAARDLLHKAANDAVEYIEAVHYYTGSEAQKRTINGLDLPFLPHDGTHAKKHEAEYHPYLTANANNPHRSIAAGYVAALMMAARNGANLPENTGNPHVDSAKESGKKAIAAFDAFAKASGLDAYLAQESMDHDRAAAN
jgi:hypothetical protein